MNIMFDFLKIIMFENMVFKMFFKFVIRIFELLYL